MLPVRLSILVPVYNEANSVSNVLERIVGASSSYFETENIAADLIVVDDGSSDKSYAAVREFSNAYPDVPLKLLRHHVNLGKGAAIRTALAHAQSDFCIIQDADFEYDPAEYPRILGPLLAGEADVVLGSRFLQVGERHRSASGKRQRTARLPVSRGSPPVWTCRMSKRVSKRFAPLSPKPFRCAAIALVWILSSWSSSRKGMPG